MVPPAATPSANFGAGEPRFVFYSPLTWMLGAALGFVLPWTLVPVVMTFLLLAGTGLVASAAEAADAADALGYPVMVKATGGGGGIGIQPCGSSDEVVRAFESVSRVAGAGFRTTGVFLERLVERARHVEVQVVGDGDGGVVVLGDRDCSLQRRNQKVVEEAPAPDLPDRVRRSMAESASRLAHTVRYRSVGTVEYVYDTDREEAAFLEVNTRRWSTR